MCGVSSPPTHKKPFNNWLIARAKQGIKELSRIKNLKPDSALVLKKKSWNPESQTHTNLKPGSVSFLFNQHVFF